MAYHPNIPTPTGVVQDELAQMRENFQHLDPLAQAIDELQAVSGLAQITDELQTVSELAPIVNDLQAVSGLAQITDDLQAVSELAPYVQALLDSRIVEMGSNSNGTYVRWENGLQICYHQILGYSFDYGVWNTFVLPAAFVNSAYTLLASMGGGMPNGASTVVYATRYTASTFGVYVSNSNGATGVNPDPIYVLAVGAWK